MILPPVRKRHFTFESSGGGVPVYTPLCVGPPRNIAESTVAAKDAPEAAAMTMIRHSPRHACEIFISSRFPTMSSKTLVIARFRERIGRLGTNSGIEGQNQASDGSLTIRGRTTLRRL